MKRGTVEVWVGVFIAIGLVCVGYLTIKLGKMEWIGDNFYTISAQFQSVAGLKKGAQVEIAGVQIGKVDRISLNQKQMVAEVHMKIEKGLQLSEDSIASIKTSGLIGDKYIKISPGGMMETIEPGGIITETESAIDLEDMISKYVFGGV